MVNASEFRKLREKVPDTLPVTQQLLDNLLLAADVGSTVNLEHFAVATIASITDLERRLNALERAQVKPAAES